MKFLAIIFISAFVMACGPDRQPEQAATGPATAEPGNAGKTQERADTGPTAFDQGGDEADRAITQSIRKSLVDDDKLSTRAQNVTIVSRDGAVTLRGQVENEAEKKQIEERAQRIAGVKNVENQLEVTN